MINLNWNVPINRLPLMDWATLSTRYNSSYTWTASPIVSDTMKLGNTIKNSSTSQLNGQINLLTLYNKVPYFKKLNQKYSRRGGRGGRGGSRGKNQGGKKDDKEDETTEHVEFTKLDVSFKANIPKSINHQLQTEDVSVTVYDSLGNRLFGQQKILNENRITYKLDKDMAQAKVVVKGRKKKRPDYLKIIFERSLTTLMSVKNLSVSYSFNNGTILPGYLPETNFFGSEQYNGGLAPGIPFILGWQDKAFARKAADKDWITTDPTLNSPFTMNSTQTFNFRSSIQPIDGMRIDITANRTFAENVTEYYLADDNGVFTANSKKITGNFSMSFGTWGTAFEKLGDDYSSEVFQTFKDARLTIAQRLRTERLASGDPDYSGATDDDGFPDGYGLTSQEVLIPAFLAAYGNVSPTRITLNAFPSILSLRPNWRVTWDGLSKIEWVKRYFKTVSVGHTYRSTYNVGSYNTNLDYIENSDGFSTTRDLLNNYLPHQEINSVSINEQFSPLINFDLTWNNSLTTKVELKKTRNLTLSFANQQMTEVRSQEYIVGAGYRIQDLKLYVNGREFKSDLTIRVDFSLRQNWTVLRQLTDVPDQITSGQRIIGIKTNADYVLSERFNVRFFVDYANNKPYVSLSYPTSNTSIGFSVRFTLM